MIPPEFSPLHGDRVALRPFRAADLPDFVAYRSDPEVARYQSWDGYDMAQAEALLAEQRALRLGVSGTWYQLAIADADDQLIGDVGLHFLDEGRQLELGFTLAAGSQGKGLATQALTLVLDLAFGDWQMHRARALTDVDNARSIALLERLGFRREGHFVASYWLGDAWGDELAFALLAREWRAAAPSK